MAKRRKQKRQKGWKQPKYYQYIKSKAWRNRRKQALIAANFRCEICGSTEDLHVHHLNYKRVGREKKEDLQVLCDQCHKNEHDIPTFLDEEYAAIVGD